ncbi:hypothetical protein P171DRAFT_32866 [Karstenula rhodostoma CBS 690.94]|uniref:Uncharacterized protein n=1 Tax=Karstenula rhodostoma CBS 690.94 TaxID=1392251 RepID=A0A9P4UAF3_9PLEO|nr:hypothetical protein P171DRAFT_32866 [Karstenula rhodostoma CBS 690.94]
MPSSCQAPPLPAPVVRRAEAVHRPPSTVHLHHNSGYGAPGLLGDRSAACFVCLLPPSSTAHTTDTARCETLCRGPPGTAHRASYSPAAARPFQHPVAYCTKVHLTCTVDHHADDGPASGISVPAPAWGLSSYRPSRIFATLALKQAERLHCCSLAPWPWPHNCAGLVSSHQTLHRTPMTVQRVTSLAHLVYLRKPGPPGELPRSACTVRTGTKQHLPSCSDLLQRAYRTAAPPPTSGTSAVQTTLSSLFG